MDYKKKMEILPKDKVKTCFNAGLNYLEKHCRKHTGFQTDSIGDSRTTLKPNFFPESIFSSLMALDLLGDVLSPKVIFKLRYFICPEEVTKAERSFCVDGTTGKPVYTGAINFTKFTRVIPDDTEDTALYHYIHLKDGVLSKDDPRVMDIARLTFSTVEDNNCIQIYFQPMEKERWGTRDAGSMVNALRFLYYLGIDHELFISSEDYVYDWLVSGKYKNGTRYYPSPELFLFFCAEAVTKSGRALKRFREPLLEQLKARVDHLLGQPIEKRYPIDYASCILGLVALNEIKKGDEGGSVGKVVGMLCEMQKNGEEQGKARGAWPADALYKLGRTATFLGGAEISTIFAVAALHRYQNGVFQ